LVSLRLSIGLVTTNAVFFGSGEYLGLHVAIVKIWLTYCDIQPCMPVGFNRLRRPIYMNT